MKVSITRKQAIEALMDLSLTQEEAERFLKADCKTRRQIVRQVQKRAKRGG